MKVVREHLYEEFSEDSDPIADMGIGWDNLSPEKKWKVPLKERPNHIIDQKQHIYSQGYQLWKLLEYILKAGGEGRRYKELVDYESDIKGLTYKRRTPSQGTFIMLKRNTDKEHRKKFHRYILNNRGYSFFNRYKKYFDDGKDFSNENDETE